MTDTTTRTRHVVQLYETGNTAVGVAVGILRAAGINTMMDLSAAIGGGQFDEIDADSLAAFNKHNPSGIETAYAYPDRVYRLSDGTALMADRSEAEEFGIVLGGVYADEVLVQPITDPVGAAAAAAGAKAASEAAALGGGPETVAGAAMGAAAFAAEKLAHERDTGEEVMDAYQRGTVGFDPDSAGIEGDPSGVDRITAHRTTSQPISADDHEAQRERDAALFDEQEPDEADPVDPDHPSNLRV